MATRHPYSFGDPVEPSVTRRHSRRFQLSDERGRTAAWDSEAPPTAHDYDVERKESRAPIYIAGIASAAILGGLMVLLGAVMGDPPMNPTAVTETVPRQAALLDKLDAQALDRARMLTLGETAARPPTPTTVVEIEATDAGAMSVEAADSAATSAGATSNAATGADATSTPPAGTEPAQSLPSEPAEPSMTPAANPMTPSAIELDSDNPYTTERERPADAPPAPPQRETGASDNPY